MDSTLKTSILGDFSEEEKSCTEHLTIVFSPSSVPLEDRWRTHHLSASFLADYFSTFSSNAIQSDMKDPKSEMISSITFIANELLENAMKFGQDNTEEPIRISIYLYPEKLIFVTQNRVASSQEIQLKAFIQELLEGDPMELYFKKLEQNVEDDMLESSGLGILTMINDYQAQIGWKFESEPEAGSLVTSRVQITLR